ncbi:Myosin heavy chain, striated muscle [Phytophthora palmivora]|uniref:Myosin heavy chain, striated muscle n=1 Tax=Phytophthora palmivora TaxID=4796 RepID=A0A2P4Y6P6_9STRA|nr:Myosin heavy chain, striated muscle [Phytophthora palmivora]
MSDHGHDGSQHGSDRHDPPSPRSEISGPAGGTAEDHHRSTAALRRRVLHLSNELRQATRRADEATDLNREHVCSLESLEMMCANQGREIGHYRAEALKAQIVDVNQGLDRRIDEIRHLQAHIDDLARDRGNLESTIHHLASEMVQAGGEILDLQQANRDLNREREDAESTLSATEENLLPTGPTKADLYQIVRERDSLQDQIRAQDAEILSAQRTLGLLQSDLAAHRARSASDKAQLQTLEGDITRARHDVEVAQKAYADRERTITENQAQIRTLSRDLGKVVHERDALRHEYTAAFQRLTSISATIGAPPPQTQLRLDPGSDTDQPAGGIPRSPSAETSGSEDQDVDTSKSKRSRSRSSSPSPSRPQKKRSVPLEADGESMDEEDESEFDLGGGSAGGRSPSPDQASTPPSKDGEPSQSSGEVIEVGSGSDEEEEENAEVADDLYEAQTLMAISQSRSEARRRDHASPQRRSAGGSGGSPGGSDGSNSDTGSRGQGNGFGPTGGSGPTNPPPGRQSPRITFVPQVPFPEGRCIPGRRIVRVMAAADIDPWIESRLANQILIAMTVNFLFPILPFRPDWIFPHRSTIYTSLTAPAFCGHLITEANVKALQAAEP